MPARFMNFATAPNSLHTPTLEEGRLLAKNLAQELHAQSPRPTSMEDNMKTSAANPSPEWIEAIYFHAIALVNHGWPRVGE